MHMKKIFIYTLLLSMLLVHTNTVYAKDMENKKSAEKNEIQNNEKDNVELNINKYLGNKLNIHKKGFITNKLYPTFNIGYLNNFYLQDFSTLNHLFKDKIEKDTESNVEEDSIVNFEEIESVLPIDDVEFYEEITLLAAGDNLIHSGIISAGKRTDGSYNYDDIYSGIKEYINEFDIRVLNQETVFTTDESQFSGYPLFGGPIEIGQAVANTGFNVITHATNHSYDKKLSGITDTLTLWKTLDIPVIGMYESQEDYDSVFIYEIKNTKIAMVNYTYGLNGLKLPKDKQYLVTTLNDKEKIIKDLQYAEDNADITIVFPHWGTEYTHTETKEQINWAEFFVKYGADLIIGTHPHVIEPLKIITNDEGQQVPVYYSIGNFMSSQDKVPRVLGAFAEVTIVNDNGNVYIKTTNMTPIVTHATNYNKSFNVYLLENYSEDLASKHNLRRKLGNDMSYDNLIKIWEKVSKNNQYISVE